MLGQNFYGANGLLVKIPAEEDGVVVADAGDGVEGCFVNEDDGMVFRELDRLNWGNSVRFPYEPDNFSSELSDYLTKLEETSDAEERRLQEIERIEGERAFDRSRYNV
jgi:hypothetical protein